MKIRLTCPKCQAPKTLAIRTLDIGLKVRTRCACGQAIIARASQKMDAVSRLMNTVRGLGAVIDGLPKKWANPFSC